MKFLSKLPTLGQLFMINLLIGLFFGWNVMWADLMGDEIVLHDGVCQTTEFNDETGTGELICGEFTRGGGTLEHFNTIVYLQKKDVQCKVTKSEYINETNWQCQVAE